MIQDNIGPGAPSASASTSSPDSSQPLQNMAQITSSECMAIIPQGLPSAPEHIAAPQDGQSSATMLAPISVDTPALAASVIIPQGLPSAPEGIAAPQDGQSSATMLAPIPINTPALPAPAIIPKSFTIAPKHSLTPQRCHT